MSALFVLLTLHMFVMYARSDETHIFQGLILAIPVLFVQLGALDGAMRTPDNRAWLRAVVLGATVLLSSSLFVVPNASAFQLGRGDWKSPKLEHLRYRRGNEYVRPSSPFLSDHAWDLAEDQAGAYVKSISKPGEDMLLLMANGLLFFDSETRPIAGRYHFYFYLASVGLLHRDAFDRIVPREVILDILRRPPRVIVCGLGAGDPLVEAFPEFRWLRDTRYVETRHFRHILIYELRVNGLPVNEPLR